jgi:uncharacterized protein
VSGKKIRFEWDPRKSDSNKRKHRISFELATLVFLDRFARSELEGNQHGKERWRTTGEVERTLIVVSHTFRKSGGSEIVRIISARKATGPERRRFEAE